MDEQSIDLVIKDRRMPDSELRRKIAAAWDAYIEAVCKGRSEEEKASLYQYACRLTDGEVQ